MVGRTPFIFSNTYPAISALTTFFILFFFKMHNNKKLGESKVFLVSDAIGLISFSIIGSTVAYEQDFNLFGITFAGFLTAVGGSIVRDILLNKIPYIMKKDFYGTIAIMVAFTIGVLSIFDLVNGVLLFTVFAIGLVLRLLAIEYRWQLSKFNL